MRVQHECVAFSPNRLSFRHFAKTILRVLQLSILTNINLSCLPCPRLGRYSSHAANEWQNGQLQRCQLLMRRRLNLTASTSQHSMWSLWWHSTSDELSDSVMTACSPFTMSLSKTINYHGSHVSAHWCVYERTCQREVGYKQLMTVCRLSLLWNSATDDDIYNDNDEFNKRRTNAIKKL